MFIDYLELEWRFGFPGHSVYGAVKSITVELNSGHVSELATHSDPVLFHYGTDLFPSGTPQALSFFDETYLMKPRE